MSGAVNMAERPLLKELCARGILRDLDVQLVASLIRTLGADVAEPVALVLMLASRAVGDGHICLDLGQLDKKWILDLGSGSDGVEKSPELERTLGEVLPTDPCVAVAGCKALVGDGTGAEPFVLEGDLLYVRRFWRYERDVAKRLSKMAASSAGTSVPADVEEELRGIERFSEGQRDAVRGAFLRKLTVVTGGPGTGKTTAAAQILRMLARAGGPLCVRMAAPTGKAAARMDESVRQALGEAGSDVPELEPACTIERLLGFQDGSPYFRHDRNKPLTADVVVIDEASMIDLAKLAKLLDALNETARLVLLGDMNQLASVQPGSVMAELCGAKGLSACVVKLTESHRFADSSAVGQLSKAVNAGDAAGAWSLVSTGVGLEEGKSLVRRPCAELVAGFAQKLPDDFKRSIRAGYGPFLAATEPAEVFQALRKFRVLCALRRGPQGVVGINAAIENILAEKAAGGHHLKKRG